MRRPSGRGWEASPSCCSSGPSSIGARSSCPAGSSSGPPSLGRWSRTPISSSSTSRWPTSTTSCARGCGTSCRGSSRAARARSCTRPASPRRPSSSAATPRPSTRDASRSTGRPATSTGARTTSRRPGSSPIRRSTPPTSSSGGTGSGCRSGSAGSPTARLRALPDGAYTVGLRPHHVRPAPGRGQGVEAEGKVLIAEISGSESVIHFDLGGLTWVSLSHGVHGVQGGRDGAVRAGRRAVSLLRAGRGPGCRLSAASEGAVDGAYRPRAAPAQLRGEAGR